MGNSVREDEGEVSVGCLLRKRVIVNNQAGTHSCLDPVQPPTVTFSAFTAHITSPNYFQSQIKHRPLRFYDCNESVMRVPASLTASAGRRRADCPQFV